MYKSNQNHTMIFHVTNTQIQQCPLRGWLSPLFPKPPPYMAGLQKLQNYTISSTNVVLIVSL